MGYYPFSSFGSRYNVLYRDRHDLGAPRGATRPSGRAVVGHDTARMGHDKADRSQGHAVARARGLAGRLCHDTIVCIVIGGRSGHWG